MLFRVVPAVRHRHHLAHVVWEGEIIERSFSPWTLGFVDTRYHELDLPQSYIRFLECGIFNSSQKTPTTCKRMLTHLRDKLLLPEPIPFIDERAVV